MKMAVHKNKVRWVFFLWFFWGLWMGNFVQAEGGDFQTSDSIFKANINPNPQLAAEEFGKQEALASTQEDKSEFLINKGLLYFRMAQMDSALIFNLSGLNLAVDPGQKSRALRYRGQFFQRLDQQDSALACLKEGQSLLAQSEDAWVTMTQMIAQTYLRLHLHDSTKTYIDRAKFVLQRRESSKSKEQMASFYDLEGQLNLYLSRFDSAMFYFSHALEHYRETENIGGQTLVLGRIGGLMSFQGRDRDAIPYYRQAIALREEEGDAFKAAELYNNLGIVFQGVGALDSALTCYRVAMRTAAVSQSPRFYGNVLGNLGGIYELQGAKDSALYYLKESQSIFTKMKDGYGMCLTSLGLGGIYSNDNQPKAALQELLKARELAEELRVPELRKDSYDGLFTHFKSWGPADSALSYLEKLVSIRDSLNSAEVQKETDRLRIKFESQIKEEENKRLEGELGFEIEQRGQERLVFLVIGIGGLVLLVSWIILLYFRSQARKRSLMLSEAETMRQEKDKLAAQQRLTKALQQITEKDQLLGRLEDELRQEVDTAAFADKLHERINSNQDWMQFMIEFELIYKDFFQSLNPQENKLTKNDLKLAALIKLNLSNKEIAEVQNITPDGVKKAKNRLRKKLALPPEKSLFEFVS